MSKGGYGSLPIEASHVEAQSPGDSEQSHLLSGRRRSSGDYQQLGHHQPFRPPTPPRSPRPLPPLLPLSPRSIADKEATSAQSPSRDVIGRACAKSQVGGKGRAFWADGLWPRPKLLRKGGLNEYDYEQERETTASELYFDLVFVVACSRLGEKVSTHPGDFAAMLLVFWWFWSESLMYATRFGSNDLPNMVFFSMYMSAVLGMVINMDLETKLTEFLFFSLLGYAGLLYAYGRVVLAPPSLLSEKFAKFYVLRIFCFAIPVAVSLVLSRTETQTKDVLRQALLVFGIIQQLSIYLQVVFMPCVSKGFVGGDTARWYDRDICGGMLSCMHIPQLPLHLEHFTERMGLFVMIVLGYTIEEISPSDHHCKSVYAAVFLSFGVLTCIKMLYFDSDVNDLMCHALRRHRLTGVVWASSHLGLTGGIVALGSSMHRIVSAAAAAEPALCEFDIDLGAKRLFTFSIGCILFFLSVSAVGHVREWNLLERVSSDDEEYAFLLQVTRIRVFQFVANATVMLLAFLLAAQPSGVILQALHGVTLLGIFFSSLLFLVIVSFLDEHAYSNLRQQTPDSLSVTK